METSTEQELRDYLRVIKYNDPERILSRAFLRGYANSKAKSRNYDDCDLAAEVVKNMQQLDATEIEFLMSLATVKGALQKLSGLIDKLIGELERDAFQPSHDTRV